ncbi:MAG TPA: alpha/beta hydrolase [Pseudomonadales bacterium]|nr:alpha/beta hydrolase [Pseudomonadales bacterium]
MTTGQIEFRTSRGNLRLVADAYGDPSSQPVLLAHGGGQTRHAWGKTAEQIADEGFYAVALDLRGHGESDWSDDADYSAFTYAQDVMDVARTFSQKPIAVGASLGGISSLTAQDISGHDLLRALVLVDITPHMESEGLMRIRDFMLEHAANGFASLEDAADFVASYTPHRKRSSNHEGLRKNLRLGEDGRYRWHWDPRFLDRRPHTPGDTIRINFLEEAARALSIPTLLVRGRVSDLVSPESARAFLEMVPHAQYVDIQDAGHMVAGDQNDIFSNAVLDFLRQIR